MGVIYWGENCPKNQKNRPGLKVGHRIQTINEILGKLPFVSTNGNT
jgi:hypothetical protein